MTKNLRDLENAPKNKKSDTKPKSKSSKPRDIDFVSHKPMTKTKEISRWRVSLAKLSQNLAYICLVVGCIALVGVIAGLAITYWPSDPDLNDLPVPSNISSDVWGWGNVQILTYTLIRHQPAMIVIQILIAILVLLLIIWSGRLAIQTMRRLTWRLADALMRSLAFIEPILLLTVWLLAIIIGQFLIEDEPLLAFNVIGFAFLVIGQVSFLIMRKLSGKYLDFTRAKLISHK